MYMYINLFFSCIMVSISSKFNLIICLFWSFFSMWKFFFRCLIILVFCSWSRVKNWKPIRQSESLMHLGLTDFELCCRVIGKGVRWASLLAGSTFRSFQLGWSGYQKKTPPTSFLRGWDLAASVLGIRVGNGLRGFSQ